jgi:hypothetical protein
MTPYRYSVVFILAAPRVRLADAVTGSGGRGGTWRYRLTPLITTRSW